MFLKTIVKWIRRLLICGFVFAMTIYSISYLMPAPDLGQGHSIHMYDNKQNLFYQSNKQSNDVKLKDVSKDFLASIVAIEDHRFFKHHGFDPIGIMRAIKANFTNGAKSEGASTITQQYARLLFLTNEKSWTRKITEAYLTTRLETHYDKNTLLEGYINTVYFGHGIYGIENAAHYYFNKSPKDLDLNEASMLAGVINGPSYYSPFQNKESAKKRQKLVLNRLVELGYITHEKATQVSNTPFQLNPNPSASIKKDYPYYRNTVIDELKKLGFYKESYINQGLHIQTTLDKDVQEQLDKVIQKQMKERGELEVSSIILDSQSSEVLALIGGKDYQSSQFNRATKAKRQVASTIKPLLYYIALENGFTPTTKFKSEATTFQLENGETYAPTNVNQKYANQDITLAQAISVSDNIYAVKTHMFLGEQALVNALHQFGFNHISPHPSLALGTLNTNVYQLSSIYATLSHYGIYNDVHTIKKITTSTGRVLYEYKPQNKELFNKDSCLILSQLLTSPFDKRYSTYATATMASYPTKATFAAKSGTSPYDSLCAGYNPRYTIVNWSGYDDNRELTMSLDKQVPKAIFQSMANYLQKDELWYEMPSSLKKMPIDVVSGEYNAVGPIYWFKK